MTHTLDFESQKLQVHYIAFNLRNGKNKYIKIAKYFHKYHQFNCDLHYEKTGIRESYLANPNYQHKMVFVFNINPVNANTLGIQFSGLNAQQLYSILKATKLDWNVFNLKDLKLSRFDINYIRFDRLTNQSNLLDFYERSVNKFKTRYPNSEAEIIRTTLGLGTRTGDYFLRVYVIEGDNDLKFELEIKKYKSKSFLKYLINNCFVEFEKSVVTSFVRYLKLALVFDTPYTDWLTFRLRKTNKPTNHLVSNYLQTALVTDSIEDKLTFYRILQFISFTRTCSFKQESLNGEIYRSFSFPLVNFAKQINLHPLNSYRRNQLVRVIKHLQTSRPLQWVADYQFRSLLMCPVIRIDNKSSKYTKIIIHISTSELFYQWKYPFYFPHSFYTFQNRNDLKLKFAIIESITTQESTRKVLHLENIFNRLNNQNKASMKKNLIEQFQLLTDGGFIENQFQLEQKDNQFIIVDKLTIELINSTKQLIFYENINSKCMF
jgi:hypothetical protein